MALTQREKMIAIGLTAVIGCYGVWEYGILAYIDKRAQLVKDVDQRKADIEKADKLQIDREARKPVWEYMKSGGLDNSLADSRLGQMLEAWAGDSRRPPGSNFRITGGSQSGGSTGSPNSPLATNGFTELKVQVQAEGNQKGLAWILWNLERVSVPVKVNQVMVKPRADGRDELRITLSLSTLAIAPTAGRTP